MKKKRYSTPSVTCVTCSCVPLLAGTTLGVHSDQKVNSSDEIMSRQGGNWSDDE